MSNGLRAFGWVMVTGLLGACGGVVEADFFGLDLDGASTQLTGTLTAMWAEDPVEGRGELLFHLVEALGPEDAGLEPQRFAVELGAMRPERVAQLRDGDTVQLRGVLRGDALHVGTQFEANALSSGEAADESMLVLAEAPAAVEQKVLVILANFTDATVSCSAASVQSLMFGGAGSISDYYSVVSNNSLLLSGDVVGPFNINFANSTCDTNGWASAANAAATAAGVNVGAYSRLIYVVPSGSCGYAGYGSLGGSPSRSWILGYCGTKDVYAHELGHNLNMHHASTPGSEYGDRSCIMGLGGSPLRHLNGPHTVQMGWRQSTQATTGTYDLNALALGGSPSVLRIPIDSSNGYFISFRDSTGYDANLASGYRFRTAVHTYTSGQAKTFLQATLADGGSFTDATLGLTISQVSNTGTGGRVQISMNCVENAPTLALSPSSRLGKAGDTLSYSLTLTNRDGQGCAARTFDIGASSAWPATLSTSQVILLPGASSVVSVGIAAPNDGTSGSISFTLSASVAGVSLASVAGSAGIDGIAPTTPTKLTATGDSRQVKLAWLGSTDDSGSVSYRIWRSGALIATVATTSFSDRGANSKSTFTYEVDAIDPAGNASAKVGPVAITVATKGPKNR